MRKVRCICSVRAVVGHLDSDVGDEGQRDPCRRSGGMLHCVRQCFLHDPHNRQLHAGRQVLRLPIASNVNNHPGVSALSDDGIKVVERWLRREFGWAFTEVV